MKNQPSPTLKKHPRKTSSQHPKPVEPGPSSLARAASTRLEVITIPGEAEPPQLAPGTELRRVRFGYFKPDAHEVFVVGSFNGWNPCATPLKRDAVGDWTVELALPPGEYRYRLIVDGQWCDDPSAQQTAMNPYGGFDGVVVV